MSNQIVATSDWSRTVAYAGTKSALVGAGIADENDFPVWPKRRSISGVGDSFFWEINYQKGGGFVVTHYYRYGVDAEDALPFVGVSDGRYSCWANDPDVGKIYAAMNEQQYITGRLYLIALLRVMKRSDHIQSDLDLAEIFQSLPRTPRASGFLAEFKAFLNAACCNIDYSAREGKLRADLLEVSVVRAA